MNYLVKIVAILLAAFTLLSCNLLSAARISSQGQPTKSIQGSLHSTTANSSVNLDHLPWDVLLKKHVTKDASIAYKKCDLNLNKQH